jgi:hypothetical protein
LNQYKAHRRTVWHLNTVSGADTITAKSDTSFRAYEAGMTISWKQASENTGAATINISGRGAVTIQKAGAALAGGEMAADAMCMAVHDGSVFQLLTGTGGGSGGGGHAWARVNASGTIIGDDGVASASRSAEGVYLVNLDSAASSSSALGAVATPSTASGNGGGGVSPYLAYDSYDADLTDNDVDSNMYFVSAEDWLIVFGCNTDDIWIHDINAWNGTPTQVSVAPNMVDSLPGCLTYEQDAVFVSANASGADVAYVTIPGGTVTSFGAGPIGSTRRCVAAKQVGGSLRLWMADGGTFGRWSPNVGTSTMGSSDFTYTGVDWNQSGDFRWDDEGYLWYPAVSTAMHQYLTTGGTKYTHSYPITTPSGVPLGANPGGYALVYDSNHRTFYTILRATATSRNFLYAFKNWATTPLSDSGEWEYIAELGDAAAYIFSLAYEAASDILLVTKSGSDGYLRRYVGSPKRLLDTVTMPGTIGSHEADTGAHYGSNYAYVRTDISGNPNYIVRVSYNGAELTTEGGESIIGSVLVAMATVMSSSQIKVELFRNGTTTIVREDGEFTVVIPTT